jgi:hypothetical protein
MNSRICELDDKLRRYLLIAISLHARYCRLPQPAGIMLRKWAGTSSEAAPIVIPEACAFGSRG